MCGELRQHTPGPTRFYLGMTPIQLAWTSNQTRPRPNQVDTRPNILPLYIRGIHHAERMSSL